MFLCLLAYAQVGVFYEHLGFGGFLQGGVDFGHEPTEHVVVAADGGVVGAEHIDAIVLEIPLRQFYVVEQAFPGIARCVGAAEQAKALEMPCNVLGADVRRYALVPAGAKGGVEGLRSATELHPGGVELAGKALQLISVHVVRLEPDGVYAPFTYNPPDILYGAGIQFHGRAGVDDVQHAELTGHPLQHRPVRFVWIFRSVLVVVAEGAPPPLALSPLEEKEFPGEFVSDYGIPVHAFHFCV